MRIKKIILILLVFKSLSVFSQINVVTTTQDLGSITQAIGGEFVRVTVLAKGTQDPHHLEAKPSFILAANRADLVICVGLALETGWLPLLLKSARQVHLMPGSIGYLDASQAIKPIEVNPNVDRSQGDVHPMGNPHYLADPRRGLQVAALIFKKLSELDKKNEQAYRKNLDTFEKLLQDRISAWVERFKSFKKTKIIGYHTTFNYLFEFLELEPIGFIESKPGIPPSSKHILKLIQLAKGEHVKAIIIEEFFERQNADRLAKEMGAKVVKIPAYAGGTARTVDYLSWLDEITNEIYAALAGSLQPGIGK